MQHQPLISAQDLKNILTNQTHEVLVIDARYDLSNPDAGQQLYAQGHIEGAVFLDLGKDLCGVKTGKNGRHPLPEKEKLVKRLQAIGLNNNMRVVVYDQKDSMFAAHLWWVLLWLGHSQVQVLDGGLTAWQAVGGSTSTQIPAITKQGNFQAQPPLTPTVDAVYVLKHLESPEMQIVDARAPERFRGDVEPLDPVAGHIPGAANRPFALNLNANGQYKSAVQLKEEWTQLLAGQPLEALVHQCGSGVSACHNILAMAHAGLGITAIYPGSWSEWCANPNNPTQTG